MLAPAKQSVVILIIAGIFLAGNAIAASSFLNDNFSGAALDPKIWYIPTYDHSGDGTYVGRTQFRVTQDSALPAVSAGNICVPVQTYHPDGHSFFGTEIITRQQFMPGKGLDLVVRARMTTRDRPGIVGGLFLYALKPGSNTLHDEIDFELLTNIPGQAQTNIYGNEPLGAGHVQLIPYQSGTITDEHTYEIQWLPDRVSWLIDGQLVRSTTSNIPVGPMNFYLNVWVPDAAWPQAFSESIQPTNVKEANVTLDSLCAASVIVKPLVP